jgi:hypothetical protein
MRHSIRVLAAIVLCVPAIAATAAERSFSVRAFDRIELSGPHTVEVTTGPAASVRAEGTADALDSLRVRVDGGTLEIDNRGIGSNRNAPPARIIVTTPEVRGIELAGSGSVSVNRIAVRTLDIDVSGSGNVTIAAADVRNFDADVSGSGTVTAAGRCDRAGVEVSGSGRVEISRLKCSHVDAELRGTGAINAFASQTADLSTVGTGNIAVTGGARCQTARVGTGRATCN